MEERERKRKECEGKRRKGREGEEKRRKEETELKS